MEALSALMYDQIAWHNSISPESRKGSDEQETSDYVQDILVRHERAKRKPKGERSFEVLLWEDGDGHIPAAATISFSGGNVGSACEEGHDLIECPETRTAYLEELVVSASERGQGTGSAFIEEIFSHVASLGCSQIWLACYASNPKACAFYEKSGMHPVRVVYEKKLDE